MFKERVDQKAIIAIREGKNSAQKPGPQPNLPTWLTQKMAKLSHWVQGMPASGAAFNQALPKSAPARVYTAWPPIQLWMPNQPQAMKARSRAGTLAPKTPNEARARTG